MTSPSASPATIEGSRSFRIGRFQACALRAGSQWLDGGAMFGIIPRPLWEKKIAPDAKHRIPLAMRCMVVEHDVGLVLIDNGAGTKEAQKFYDIYGIDVRLDDALREAGYRPEDVALVINTHLHFDHAGGNTIKADDGTIRPAFSNARYVMDRGEYHYATHTNERTAGSYFPHNFVPLVEQGLVDFVEGEQEIVPGISMYATPGHTPHHKSVLIDGGGERALFLADVMPTTAHVPHPWIMGYDVEPLVTLESKRRLLREAAAEDWLLVFEHDHAVPAGRVRAEGKGYELVPGP
ncbi:MAG: MBL fold metallo-hydrolase [Gemmatimonadaceae bacterium]